MNLLAITGSPRKKSFSSALLYEFLNPFAEKGFKIDIISAYDVSVHPCTACGHCSSRPECIFNDDMTGIYELIRNSDIVSISSPLYFSSFPAPLKLIIDRCQLLWEENRRDAKSVREKSGLFFCSAGSDYREMFSPALTAIRHFFNSINTSFDINEAILISNCDKTEEISPAILEKCRMLGIKYSD